MAGGIEIKIQLVDDEPRWILFIKSIFNKDVVVTQEPQDGFDLTILSSLMLDKVNDIKDNFIIVSGQPTTREAIKAY